jgi:hypothetical protein
VLVLVHDLQLDVLGLDRCRRLGRKLELELLTALEPVALRPRTSVDEDIPALDEPFRSRARADLGQLGEEAVEPRARSLLGDPMRGRREPGAAACAGAAGRAAPRTMKLSARLNAGQKRRSMKSVT